MTQSLQSRPRPPFEPSNLHPLGQSTLGRQDSFEQGRPGWQQQQTPQNLIGQFSPSGRSVNLPLYGQHPHASSVDNSFEHDAPSSALMHQQEQRGVSQLQNAVSAATNGTPGRTSLMQISPGSGPSATLAQPGGLAGLPGQQGDLKKGPVEFNHAISYVNKIKVSCPKWP